MENDDGNLSVELVHRNEQIQVNHADLLTTLFCHARHNTTIWIEERLSCGLAVISSAERGVWRPMHKIRYGAINQDGGLQNVLWGQLS